MNATGCHRSQKGSNRPSDQPGIRYELGCWRSSSRGRSKSVEYANVISVIDNKTDRRLTLGPR